ncbi:MAG: peptidoglycan DD-metalloendopeptidase family protein [Patescibacteria group bacterium]|jgi:murein DD-endopeptidase MepM/ murein hydrolase activator NlpD
MLLKKLIIAPIKLLIGILLFLFKGIFYKILVKIYYQIFRWKRSGVIKDSPLELLWKQPLYPLITILVTVVLVSGAGNTQRAKAMPTKIKKTVASSLFHNSYYDTFDDELIEEGSIPLSLLASLTDTESYEDDLLALKKNEDLETTEERVVASNINFPVGDPDVIAKPKEQQTDLVISDTGTPIRSGTTYYTIKPGDTISSIAQSFGLTVNTILWANDLSATSLLKIGRELTIPAQSGLLYTVKSGDTLAKIAKTYDLEIDKIVAANSLGNTLTIGKELILPGARKISAPVVASAPSTPSYTGASVIKDLINPSTAKTSSNKLVWPVGCTRISQYFSVSHPGLDVACPIGTPIYAADDGVVIISQGGYNGGYGNTILLEHSSGMRTRYGHATKLYVKVGETVTRGQQIATVGSTGRSTGPHLHFEVVVGGIKYNPFNYTNF